MKERSTAKARRTAAAERARRSRDNLSPGYVRSLLTKGTSLKAADIPQSLVEAKQAELLLKRTVEATQSGDTAKLEDLESVHSRLQHSWNKTPTATDVRQT